MKKIMAIAILAGTLMSICSMASAWEVVISRGGRHHDRHHSRHHSRYDYRPRTTYVRDYGYSCRGYYESPYTVRRVYYPGYSTSYRVDEVVDTYYVY